MYYEYFSGPSDRNLELGIKLSQNKTQRNYQNMLLIVDIRFSCRFVCHHFHRDRLGLVNTVFVDLAQAAQDRGSNAKKYQTFKSTSGLFQLANGGKGALTLLTDLKKGGGYQFVK